MNPDKLRMIPKAVDFVRHFVAAGKPIGAICHGASTLIETGALKGKTVTSWPSIKTDLKNAGAHSLVDSAFRYTQTWPALETTVNNLPELRIASIKGKI